MAVVVALAVAAKGLAVAVVPPVLQLLLPLGRAHQPLPPIHRASPRWLALRTLHSRVRQVPAVNHRVSLMTLRHRIRRVPARTMRMMMMTAKIHRAQVHQVGPRCQLVVALQVPHHCRHLLTASDTIGVTEAAWRSVRLCRIVLLMAKAVGSHLGLGHPCMVMRRMLDAMAGTDIRGVQGSPPRSAGRLPAVEGRPGMVATTMGTWAGHVAPAPPARGRPVSPSARLPALAAPPPRRRTKVFPRRTQLESHARRRNLARGAGTERSSLEPSVPVPFSHMAQHRSSRARPPSGSCHPRRATAAAVKVVCAACRPRVVAVGVTGRHRLAAPLPLCARARPLAPPMAGVGGVHLPKGLEGRHHPLPLLLILPLLLSHPTCLRGRALPLHPLW